MSKIALSPIASITNVASINSNFEKIATEINNKMFSRNPEGEPNVLATNIDLNGFKIINVTPPTQPTDLIRLQGLEDITGVDTTSRQDTLVSGVNIETVNNESLLGSGNLVIAGGSGTNDHSLLLNRNLPSQHDVSAINGLQVALDSKSAIGHIHAIADVTNLQSTLDAKQTLDGDLTAIAALNTNGVLKRTASDTWVALVDVKEIVVSATAPVDTTKLWLDIN